jgi:predicted NAD/FAD-dependent oxidoreductase
MYAGIIGAGIARLAAATSLRQAGHETVVFDKARGPGGRASTRRAAPFAFDHGAQYFTARDPRFRRLVERFVHEGVAARWDGRIVSLRPGVQTPVGANTGRFVGTPHIRSPDRNRAARADRRARR